MDEVISTMAQYDASINLYGEIQRGNKLLGVRVRLERRRIRFENASTGNLLMSGPIEAATVEKFVERFWMWSK